MNLCFFQAEEVAFEKGQKPKRKHVSQNGDELGIKQGTGGFPGGSVVKNLPASAGDTGSIPDTGRSHMLQITKQVHHHCWACALEPGNFN